MRFTGVGVDMADVARFRPLLAQKKNTFLSGVFTEIELKYCLAYKDPAPHLAGTFAAKEAAIKANGKGHPKDFEVRRLTSGKPEVWIKGRRSTSMLLSITHTDTVACAVVIKQ